MWNLWIWRQIGFSLIYFWFDVDFCAEPLGKTGFIFLYFLFFLNKLCVFVFRRVWVLLHVRCGFSTFRLILTSSHPSSILLGTSLGFCFSHLSEKRLVLWFLTSTAHLDLTPRTNPFPFQLDDYRVRKELLTKESLKSEITPVHLSTERHHLQSRHI